MGRGTKNVGMLTFRVEYRDLLWSADVPPSKFAGQIGSSAMVGTGFSDFKWQFRELAWRQSLYSGGLRLVFGKISAVAWANGHVMSSPKRGFQNLTLLSSLSKPAPGRGLGLVTGVIIPKKKLAIVGGIHDANAKSANNPFDTIDQWEFYKYLELRWYPGGQERHKVDHVRLQFWHQDERAEAGVPSGQGVTFVASRLFGGWFMPAVFGGKSDGDASLMKTDVGVIMGFARHTRHYKATRDVIGLGVSWGEPANEALREQTNVELFYRFQLVEHIAFTPSVQYIINPAFNPTTDDIWLFGFRWRIPL